MKTMILKPKRLIQEKLVNLLRYLFVYPKSRTMFLSLFILSCTLIPADLLAGTKYVMQISNANANENNTGFSNSINFTVSLDNEPGTNTITVDYHTANNDAIAGNDYNSTTGTLTFTDTQKSKTITVKTIGDDFMENNETFDVVLTNYAVSPSAGNSIEPASKGSIFTGHGTIINDDTFVAPKITIADSTLVENNANMDFNVTLDTNSTNSITVTYATGDTNGTVSRAIAGVDYQAVSGSITFSPGQKIKTISVPIYHDTLIEGNEFFRLNLLSVSTNNAVLDKYQGTGTIIDNDDNVTSTCSPYIGKLVLNEYNNIPTVKDELGNTIPGIGTFIELKRLDMNFQPSPEQNWTITVYDKNNAVSADFTFAQKDYTCGVESPYIVFDLTSSEIHDQATVIVRDQNGREVDLLDVGAAYHPSSCIQEGGSFLYDTDFASSAQNKDIFRKPDGIGNWDDKGSGANSGATRCINPGGDAIGFLDAMDRSLSTYTNGNRNITTKIVNKDIELKAVSVEDNNLVNTNMTVAVWSAEHVSGSTYEIVNFLQEVSFGGDAIKDIDNFKISDAHKDMKIGFKYCEEDGIVYDDWKSCWETPASFSQRKISFSSDNFAIRPKEFYHNLTTATPLKAGLMQGGIEFKAYDDSGIDETLNYNETEHASFVADVNISDSTKSCAQASINFSPSISFTNGTNVIAGVTPEYSLPNVGDFNVTMHEIVGHEYAFVDVDDTPDTTVRLITPYTQQVKVIPHHFTIDGNLTNGSNGFTYLSNFDGNATLDQNVSALLDTNITARAFGGVATSNYTSSCYAKDGNVSLGITLPAITPTGTLSKMLWYDDINNSIQGNFPLAGPYAPLAYPALRFVSGGSNGSANVRYRLNFDRNQTMVVNPFTMVVNEVNATDIDAVDGNQTMTTNNSAYYVYGRIIPRDIRIFGENTTFTANAWYEVYNTPSIGAISLPSSKNDSGWYTNTLHSDVPTVYDGDANVTVVITGNNPTNTNITVGSGLETYTFDNTYDLGGYKAHIKTDSWLWYGASALPYLDPVNSTNLNCLTHPCFNINIVPPIGATGSAKTIDGTTSDMNKNSKKSTSGTGWHSTTDYAPAIR